jgi:hypothetical protein
MKLKQFWKKLKNHFKGTLSSERGSVLSVTLIVMVVLTASVTAVTSLTIDQTTATSIKLETVNDEVTAKRLIQQAIKEFEIYIEANEDFAMYESFVEVPTETKYNLDISDVTGTTGFEEFGVTGEGESRAYRFAYTLSNGTDLVMYSYASTTGSTVQNFNPFDFSLGTNGDLVITGGYFRDAAFFANNVYFQKRAAYIYNDTSARVTPASSGSYPDFNGNGSGADVYFKGVYEYCGGNCWDTDGVNDPFVLQKSEFLDIDGSGLETGDFTQDTVISNFFGTFSFEDTVLDFVTQVGPTDSRTINDPITLDTIRDVVLANSGVPTEECIDYKWRGRWYEYCYPVAPSDPYTDLTNEPTFTPLTDEEYISSGAFYDGDLTVRHGFHMDDREDETLVIAGDLIFDNSNYITIDGKFVVLGDLIFQGDEVDIDGAFYVLGQVFFNFDEGAGVTESGGTSEYGLAILARDNIIVNSMWESHTSSRLPDEFDTFMYTEESIYIDAVNSRMNVNGVLFANAKGVSGNYIPVVDENDDPILGIVINSYRGYINNSGNAVPSTRRARNAFYFDVVNEVNLQNAFVEVPEFDSLVIIEGVYTFETSEFRYE